MADDSNRKPLPGSDDDPDIVAARKWAAKIPKPSGPTTEEILAKAKPEADSAASKAADSKAALIKETTHETGADKVPSYKSGTSYVPKTGLALLHKGEKVTPAKENMSTKKHNVSLYRALYTLNKGGLHRALHVEEGKPIPAAKLSAAKNSSNEHVRKMAQFAHTMSTFKH